MNQLAKQPSSLTVLFLSGEENERDGSRTYRCVYQAKQIEQAGGKATVSYVGEALSAQIARADVVVMSRCLWTPQSVAAAREIHRQKKLLVGDLDDRIFCPWDADATGFLRTKALFKKDLAAQQRVQGTQRDVLRLLPAFQQTIVSTPAISEELSGLGLASHVHRNVIDASTRKLIERPRSSLRKLLFMTGTRTHDADFRVVHAPLRSFLTSHPDVAFTMLGPISPPADLLDLRNVTVVDKLPLSALHGFVAEFDACVVPLEATVFNDCKSALKFIECGAVSVPVIASPRREFREAITHEQNGLLAEDGSEFFNALQRLHASPELLQRVARQAFESVRTRHTVQSAGSALAEHLCAQLAVRPSTSRPLPLKATVEVTV